MQKERSHLDHASLLSTIKTTFSDVSDPITKYNGKFSIPDCLMSAVAIFGLKYPSLLQYDDKVHGDVLVENNLKRLYQIKNIPSDTHLRARLDDIDPSELDATIDALIVPLQRGKILEEYKFLDEYYLISIDGTGVFSSDTIHCANCCVKRGRPKFSLDVIRVNDEIMYTHELFHWESKIQKGKKDGLLLLYSPIDNTWHLYEFNNSLNIVQRAVNAEVMELLSQIKSRKISKSVIDEVATLLLEDSSLFDGKEQHGYIKYYHQTLSAVLMHPDYKEVLPLAIEPMIKQDGATKNDCERRAAFRLLRKLKKSHPHFKFVIVLDALYANGPLIKILQELDFRYIITAKNTDFLFEQHLNNKKRIMVNKTVNTTQETYVYSQSMPLNATHQDIKVNLLEYTEVIAKFNKKKNKSEENKFYSAWLTDLPINNDNLRHFMRGARSRWKSENETYNTVKNQGYHFERNFGHGDKNLCTVMCYAMFIAFLIDQIQFRVGNYYKKLKELLKSKKSMWEEIRSYFFNIKFMTWNELYQSMLERVELKVQTRLARNKRRSVNTT